MDKIQEKKFQILNDVYKSKDGLTWNELTEDLNELIDIAKRTPYVCEEHKRSLAVQIKKNECIICSRKVDV